jgi:hypothetical protein
MVLTFMTSGRGWVLNTSFMVADWSENLGIVKYLVLSRSMDESYKKDVSSYMYHLNADDSLSFDKFIPLYRWKWYESVFPLSTSFGNRLIQRMEAYQ